MTFYSSVLLVQIALTNKLMPMIRNNSVQMRAQCVNPSCSETQQSL